MCNQYCLWWRMLLWLSRCSMQGNDIDDKGASAVATALVHVPQLQLLKYVV